MPIGTSNGDHYESEMHQLLDLPTVFDDAENKQKHLSQGDRGPLKITITPHMQEGAYEQGTSEGMIEDRRNKPMNPAETRPRMIVDRVKTWMGKNQWPEGEYANSPLSKELGIDDITSKGSKGKPQSQLDEPKEVHIVRHGETTANDNNTVRGTNIPTPLNENGRAEAEKVADKLKEAGVDTLVASPLERSKETAEIIGKKLGITPQYDSRLATWDVGEHEGKPCETSNPVLEDYAKNKQDEPVPGGESFNEFINRAFAGIRDAVLNNKDKNLAIITHNRVEATLKGSEKTGQDNPDIDYKEAVQEETQPGVVRKTTFEPDATILQPGPAVGFDERFSGMPSKLPQKVPGESFKGTPSLYRPFLKNAPPWPGENFPGQGFEHIPFDLDDPMTTKEQLFRQMSEKLPGILGPMVDIASQKDIGTSRHTQKEFEDYYNKNIAPKLSPEEHKVMKDYIESSSLRGGKRAEIIWTDEKINDFRKVMQQFDKSWNAREAEASEKFGITKASVRGLYNKFDVKYTKAQMQNPSQQQQGKPPESIKAAAVRMKTPQGETIYEGHSHLNAMLNMSKEHMNLLNLPKQPKGVSIENGLITSRGRVVNRKEVAQIHQADKGRYTELSEKMDLSPLTSEEVPAIKKQKPPLTDKDMQELIDEWNRIVDEKYPKK